MPSIFDNIFRNFLMVLKVMILLRMNYICIYEQLQALDFQLISKLTIIMPNSLNG